MSTHRWRVCRPPDEAAPLPKHLTWWVTRRRRRCADRLRRTLPEYMVPSAFVFLAGPVHEPARGPEANPHHLLAVIGGLSEEEMDRLLGAQP